MKRGVGTQLVAIFVSLLLAFTMVPVAGIQSALANEPVDRPATTGGDVPMEGPAENTGLGADDANQSVTATVREDGSLVANGLIYKSEGDGATLIGFEDGPSLEHEVAVPEKLTDGSLEYTVKGVSVAEGQTAPGVLALELPQTLEDVDTESLAAAMPALARVSVDGRGGAYSSANGMLFKQESITASSDGSTTRIANRELVWAPPAMVIARVPGTCKTVASGAFVDDRALETVMVFSIVESVAKAEKDGEGNITKEGAFTDEQVSKVNIVTPMETLVYPEGDRISTDAFLAEDAPLNEKHIPWCDCGFSMDRFTVGIPYGSTSLAVAVPEDGKVGTPEITIGHYTDHPEWDPKGDTGEPQNGLVFEYKADMTVSVSWKGDKAAVPSHLELPAYVVENGVKTAVTEVAPNAFEGAAQLESVVIPEGITTVGESAFAGCSNLKDAFFPSTLHAVEHTAFLDVSLEKPVVLEDVRTDDVPIDGQTEVEMRNPSSVVDESEVPVSHVSDLAVSDTSNDAFDDNFSKSPQTDLTDEDETLSSYSIPRNAPEGATYVFYMIDVPGLSEVTPSSEDLKSFSTTDSFYTAYYTTVDYPFCFVNVANQGSAAISNEKINIYFSKTAAGASQQTLAFSMTAKSGYRYAGYSFIADEAQTASSNTTENPRIYYPKGTSIIITPHFDKDTTYDVEDLISSSITTSGKSLNTKFAQYYTKTQIDGGSNHINVNTSNLNAQAAKLIDNSATSFKTALNGLYAPKTPVGGGNYTTSNTVDTDATAAFNNSSGKLRAALDNRYALSSGNATQDWVTKTALNDNATQTWVKGQGYTSESEFGSITYSSLDGADASVYPSVYKKGGVPALPAPEKDGYAFVGWTWGSQTTPTTDVASAFSTGGNVELKANWEQVVPEAEWFFSGGSALDGSGTGEQTSVIKVRIAGEGETLSSVSFTPKDDTGLIKTDKRSSVTLWVNGEPTEPTDSGRKTNLGDGGMTADGIPLVQFEDGGWGLYVGIKVPAGAVDPEKVVKSYSGGDYVASLVTLNYEFAA